MSLFNVDKLLIGVLYMSLLKQAIVDAANLKEAALKNAEQMILEKYSNESRPTQYGKRRHDS